MENLPLKQHQAEGIEWIRRVTRGLLADEPGLGKTRTAIEAFDGGRNLVIAPKLVIEGGTWHDELRKWSTDPENPDRWRIVPYSQINVRRPKGRGYAPVKVLPDDIKGRWDAMIVDESHYVKGRDSLITWSVKEINKKTDATLLMTGTPLPNWAHEVFILLQLVYPAESKMRMEYGSFWRWAEKWFDTRPTRFSKGMPAVGEMLGCLPTLKECLARPAHEPCEHYQAFADANFGEHYMRHWRDDCLDLPPVTFQDVETPMSPAGKRAYLALKKEFYAQYEDQEIVAWNQGSKNVQLHKLTTSPWLLAPSGEPKGGKFDQLEFDLSTRTRPTLVFAHYKDTVEACARIARNLGLSAAVVHGDIPSRERAVAMESFKSGDLDVLCGSLETLSEGHTFVVADQAILVEESFKKYRNEQAVRRIHRMGQERPVSVRTYLTPNSVDTKKRRRLEMKTDRQVRVLTAAEFKEII